MKRVKDAKTTQGGGSGEGFQDPEQLRNERNESRRRTADDIMLHPKGAIFKEHLFENAGNNDAEIWKNQLHQRFQKIAAPFQSEELRQNNSTSEEGRSSSDISPEISLPLSSRLSSMIEELISLWRKGCVRKGFRPVDLYDTAEKRRLLIAGYKNNMWVSSGQKRAYQRFKLFAVVSFLIQQ